MTRWTPDPTFYPSPRDAATAPAETARLRRRLRPAGRQPGRHRRGGHRPRLRRLRPGGRLDRPAVRRRRAAPLRLERVQQRALPDRPAPARRAALPDRARACGRRGSTCSTPRPTRAAADRQGDRGRGAGRRRPATRGRTPCTAARTASTSRRSAARRRGGPGRHRHARPHHVRGARAVGDRPRAAVPGVRRLVAPDPRRAGHQRVGHAVDDRGRHHRRVAAGPQVRPRLHFWDLAKRPHPDGSTSATSTRCRWSCARRTTRRSSTGSSAW